MTKEALTTPFPWERYSKKLKAKVLHPQNMGFFTDEDALKREMRLAVGRAGSIEEGNCVTITWLLDPADGIIADAKFQTYGNSALIGSADAACDILVRKNYDQASRISAELIDKHLRDAPNNQAFPWETAPHVNLVIDAIGACAETCKGLPLPTTYSTPVPMASTTSSGHPHWNELTDPQKRDLIEQVLDQDIRPYIAMDAGGVDVDSFENNNLTITYQGSCTSCLSSVGATLSFIQMTLRNKLSSDLNVIPK